MGFGVWRASRFLSPIVIRVPFFLLFGFNKGALNQKGQKGTTQEPRHRVEGLVGSKAYPYHQVARTHGSNTMLM